VSSGAAPARNADVGEVSSCRVEPGAQLATLAFTQPGANAWLENRQNFCASGIVYEVTDYLKDSAGREVQVGEGKLMVTLRLGTRFEQPEGTAELEFGYQGEWGTIGLGAVFKISASCGTPRGANCLASESTMTDFLPDGHVAVDDWRLRAPRLGQGDRVTEFVGFVVAAAAPGGGPRRTASLVEIPAPRCDTIITPKNGGCVFPEYVPTLVYIATDPSIAETAAHIRAAQAKGLPGAPGTMALTRTMDRRKRERNRRLACGGFRKTRPDGSCDEYPFASSEQGKAFGQRVSIEEVSEPDNVAAGRQLGLFYFDNRVIGGDPFYVQVSP
jgi:hypothetical protein